MKKPEIETDFADWEDQFDPYDFRVDNDSEDLYHFYKQQGLTTKE